jgi:hypothetical protein
MRYRLVPFLNLEIGPENVRNFVGVNPRELPDDEIDLTRAYFDIETQVTQPVLELMLAGAPAERKSANNAILATVVIECILAQAACGPGRDGWSAWLHASAPDFDGCGMPKIFSR